MLFDRSAYFADDVLHSGELLLGHAKKCNA
jgi:hypothetical protein